MAVLSLLGLPKCFLRSQVAQWLSTRYSMLSPVNEEGLQKLDDVLLTRTFLLGTTLSLADLVLFGVLHRAVVRRPGGITALHSCTVLSSCEGTPPSCWIIPEDCCIPPHHRVSSSACRSPSRRRSWDA